MERKQWNKTLGYLTGRFEKILKSHYKRFKDFVNIDNGRVEIQGIPESPGVYIIFENEEPIYVGCSGKGKANLKSRYYNLFYYNKAKYPCKEKPSDPFSHILTYKLTDPNKIGRFSHPEKTRDFYINQCSFKFVGTTTIEEARALESILILQLHPRYND